MSSTNEKKGDESHLNSDETTPVNSNMSPDDLDQYGVWVKTGPETVEEESSDFEGFELSDLSDENAELTSEEEDLLGDLESGAADTSDEPLDIKLDTGGDDFSLEDMDDLSLPEEPEETNTITAAEKDFLEEESLDLDFDLDEEPLETADNDTGKETLPTAEEGLESLDLEELDQTSFEELPELEIDEEPSVDSPLPENPEKDDFDALADEIIAEGEEESPVEFDDLKAVEMEMTEGPAEPRTDAPRATQDILSKIEAELATIKEELLELKKELSYLRPVTHEASSDRPIPTEGEETEEDDGSFFDEDEDETIALTGDELDNILNTADITEERGESDVLPEDIDIGVLDDPEKPLSEHENIISLDETPSLAETIPVTTSEEQAIIEEYNRELDHFGNEEFHIDEEDAIDENAVESLPEDHLEKDDLLDIEEPQSPEMILSENDDDASSPIEEISLSEDIPEAEMDTVEFDLDALEETEIPVEEAEEEEPAAFEEELEEMEIFIPEEPDLELERAEEPLPTLEEESPELEIGFEEEELSGEVPEEIFPEEEPISPPAASSRPSPSTTEIPENLRDEIKTILKYMDQLLESLPEEKIQEFAHSEHFEVYRRLFEELELE